MSKKKRIFTSSILCLALILSLVQPVSSVLFAQEAQGEVQTANVTSESEFISALNNVDIDIIHLQNEITLSRSEDGKDNAFVIQRPVTITGEGTDGGLCLERAGIVLGGAVTFENMSIYFANPVRNAIIANGYDLTLDTVTGGGSSYNIDIFCGGVTNYNGGNSLEIPQAGTCANVTIKGTNSFTGISASLAGGNIYAGSLSDVGSGVENVANQYLGSANITIAEDASGVGKIYAHGARENREGGYPDAWNNNSTLYTVSGEVNIFLNKNLNIVVDGMTGETKNATFTYNDNGNGYLCSPTLENVSEIILQPSGNGAKANLAPIIQGGCSLSKLDVSSNTRMSFANITAQNISTATFVGGGEIIFSDSVAQVLTVTTEISGITKVAVGGIDYYGTNSTSNITEGETLIKVEASDDYGFELFPDNTYYNMILKDDGEGNWITTLEEVAVIINQIGEIEDIELEEPENEESIPEITIPMNITYATEDENNFIGDIPMLITVNGKEASREYGFSGYQYATGVTNEDIFIGFAYENDDEIFLIQNAESYENSVPTGRYEISITIPGRYMSDGENEILSFVVAIICKEHSGGTATCQSQAICEVCGTKYGNIGVHQKENEGTTCIGCEEEIVASVTDANQKITYYLSFGEALNAAQNAEESVLNIIGGTVIISEALEVSGISVTNATLKVTGNASIKNTIHANSGAVLDFSDITEGEYTIYNGASVSMNIIMPESGYALYVDSEKKDTVGAKETATLKKEVTEENEENPPEVPDDDKDDVTDDKDDVTDDKDDVTEDKDDVTEDKDDVTDNKDDVTDDKDDVTDNEDDVPVDKVPVPDNKVEVPVIKEDKVETPKTEAPKKGTVLKNNKAVYKVIKSDSKNGTVTYVAPVNKKATTVNIPAVVKINGVQFKVTAIEKNAFKNNKKIKKVTIGKNVTKIGAKAFYGCSKLKTLTIKSTKLTAKKIGSKAFSKLSKQAKLKVPKKKLKTYKTMLRKKGLHKKVKITQGAVH